MALADRRALDRNPIAGLTTAIGMLCAQADPELQLPGMASIG
jgi:hypothetical protein